MSARCNRARRCPVRALLETLERNERPSLSFAIGRSADGAEPLASVWRHGASAEHMYALLVRCDARAARFADLALGRALDADRFLSEAAACDVIRAAVPTPPTLARLLEPGRCAP